MTQQQQQQSSIPILFFSKKDEPSRRLIDNIRQNEKMMNSFRYVDILEIPRDKLPPNLESVPTIVHLGTMFKGESAFKWVNEQLKSFNQRLQQQQNSAQQQQRPIQQPPVQQQQPHRPQGPSQQYNVAEQGAPVSLSADISGCSGADCALMEQGFNGQDNRGQINSTDQYMTLNEFDNSLIMKGNGSANGNGGNGGNGGRPPKISDEQIKNFEQMRNQGPQQGPQSGGMMQGGPGQQPFPHQQFQQPGNVGPRR
jgi:hypothetical protein